MMFLIASIIILGGLVPFLSNWMVNSDNYCYSEDSKPYIYFAGKTAYEHVHAINLYIPSNCEIGYIWALIRHGTRYSSPKYHQKEGVENITKIQNQIIENHEIHKRGKLCEKDLKKLKNWTCQWSSKYPMELTPQGIADMKGIATRLKNEFNSYFNNFKDFTIQTTSRRRCQQSSMAFTNELFGTSYTTLVGNEISVNNPLLNIGFSNSSDIEEWKIFLKTSVFKNMAEEIKERLGYESKLPSQFVYYLYNYCAYENAWFVNSRPVFCAAFTTENLKILEYSLDLAEFYELGPSNQTAKQLACPLMRDMYAKLKFASNTSEKIQKGAFYFGHMETLLPTLVQLNLFQDKEPLKHDNYESQSNRSWRTSYFSSFGANLFVILFRCNKGIKISFYSNEKQVLLPGCKNNECTMREIQEIFENKILKDCMESKGIFKNPSNVLLFLNVISFLISFKELVFKKYFM